MIKVYKTDVITSEEVLMQLITEAEAKLEEHRTTVGVPAPIIEPMVHQLVSTGEEYEFVPMTEEEEQSKMSEAEAKKWQDQYEADKLAAQSTPSEKYTEFRSTEYPSLGDSMDTIIKTFKLLKANGTDIGADAEALVAKCDEVKAKYPKP